MEHLWAPWRNAYVTSGAENPAELFTRIAQSEDDKGHHVLLRSKSCYALLNAYPYNAGHSMIVPYRALGDIEELSTDEWMDIIASLKRVKAALTSAYQPQGFNVGLNLGAAAGAGIIQHLHLHLVPRWGNDANFMTATALTRVHPNDLDTIWEELRGHLNNAGELDPPQTSA